MTETELIAFFESIVDDSHDGTNLRALFNTTKNTIERLYKPPTLEEVDATQTRNAGDVYTTMKDLPSDFRVMVKLYVGTIRYNPISFSDHILHRNSARRFYIKHKDKKFAITGTSATSETITQIYIVKTPDFTAANKDKVIVTWPEEFHPLIAWKAGVTFLGGIDPDSTARAQAILHNQEYKDLLDAFEDWIHELKLSDMDDRSGFDPEEPSSEEDLGLM